MKHELESNYNNIHCTLNEPELLAREGGYKNALEKLTEHDHLETLTEKIKNEFSERVNEPWMENSDWEMLTILGAYDRTTLLHSIGVYEIAKRKLNENLPGPNNTPLQLKSIIETEGVTIPEFLRACLFHDIGKVEVPYEVLINQLTESEWEDKLYSVLESGSNNDKEQIITKLQLDTSQNYNREDINKSLQENWLRPISVIPARLVLTPNELNSIIKHGYTGDETLADIISMHEQHSASILRGRDMNNEAELAGHHHNYNHEQLQFPTSTEALSLGTFSCGESAVGLLHLADVQEALTSANRPYKESLSLLQSLSIIVDHVRHQNLDENFAYGWIRSELHSIPDNLNQETSLVSSFSGASEDDPHAQEELVYLKKINGFLETVELRVSEKTQD